MVRLACGLALGVAVATLPAGAHRGQDPPQTPPQRPTFRVATDIVRVDVYPRRSGQVVEGLTRDDFQVFEDGTAQTIETFEFVRFADEATAEELDPRDPREAMRMAADPQNRVFVIFLDTYHVTWEGALRARQPLLDFLRDGLGPRDLFGVLTPQQSPELLTFGRTTHEAAMAMTIGRSWGMLDTPTIGDDETLLQSCSMPTGRGASGLLALWRFDRTLSRLEELIVRLSAIRQERKNVIVVADRWPNVMLINRLPAPAPGAPAADQGGRGSFQPPSGLRSASDACAAESRRLGGIDFRRRFQELPELSRAANVALYIMPPGTRSLFNDPSGQFRGLAEDTDGLSIFTNDLTAGLGRVVTHQSGYYMLGYRSSAGPTDRGARTIRVRTSQRGVDLDVRREYYPPSAEDLARGDAAVPERTDVMRALDALERLRETTRLYVRPVWRPAGLDVTAEVASGTVTSGRWREGASVTVVVRDGQGGDVARGEGRIEPGTRASRVLVDVPRDRSGLRLSVRVTGPSGELSEFADVPEADDNPIGVAEITRAGSLPNAPFVPAAELQFQRTERVRVEWPLSGPIEDRTVRLVNAAGDDRPLEITVTDVPGQPPFVRAEFRLLGLAPADYVLDISGRVGDTTHRRLLGFRVMR